LNQGRYRGFGLDLFLLAEQAPGSIVDAIKQVEHMPTFFGAEPSRCHSFLSMELDPSIRGGTRQRFARRKPHATVGASQYIAPIGACDGWNTSNYKDLARTEHASKFRLIREKGLLPAQLGREFIVWPGL
jgi:hypothetical protein